jgi:phytoene dehydrogenase-like protein
MGVEFQLGAEVDSLQFNESSDDPDAVSGVCTGNGCFGVDAVVAAADYHFVEQTLLPERLRRYVFGWHVRQRPAASSWLLCIVLVGGVHAV